MFDRASREASGRARMAKRPARAKQRPTIESLEGRALMTAAIDPIVNVSVPQYLGYQVPVQGGTTHQQTYTVTSDNPGVKASITQGQFLTVGVTHTSSGTGDPTINGTMTFQLFGDDTPNAVKMISSLVNGTATDTTLTTGGTALGYDYYVGKVFHRIANMFPGANDYIVQGGSLSGTGTGQVFSAAYPDEFNQSIAFTGSGQLALANSGPDTNDSQFFVTTAAPQFLDFGYTIFGQLVEGQSVLNQLTQVTKGTDGTTPVNPITITSASLSSVSPDAVIHLDTTVAPVDATANITVTATDVTDGTTASQTFQANVTADSNSPERPFVAQYDPNLTIGSGQTAQFQIDADAPTPGDPLTYTVDGGVTSTTSGTTTTESFTAVDKTKIQSATVSATGLVTIVPVAGATGTTPILIGVRDNDNRAGTSADENPANYEYHTITLTLGNATPVALRPLSQPAEVTATAAAATPIQLVGSNPNTFNDTQPVTFALTTQPTHGTVTAFDAATGALSYTPAANYSGPDAIAYTVTDPNTGLVSFPTTVKIDVANAITGAVRFIPNDSSDLTATDVPGTLVVTPVPRTDKGTNTILAADVNGTVQITVNGVLDATQISDTDVDRLVIYGSKANDDITIDPSLSTIATIDGGHGGKNVLTAGAGQTREHGWFGKNKFVQGSSDNYDIGRQGIGDTFVKGTGTSDVIFQGQSGYFSRHLEHNRETMVPTSGSYYKFAKNGKTLVKAANPYKALNKQARQAFEAEQKLGRVGTETSGTAGTTGNSTTTTTGGAGNNGATGTTSSQTQ